MATRIFNRIPPTIKAPANLDEWHGLIRRTIDLAHSQGDRRAHGLRKALADGNAERHLRLLGIISEADLLREFPVKDS